jgi:NADH dehydrogenase
VVARFCGCQSTLRHPARRTAFYRDFAKNEFRLILSDLPGTEADFFTDISLGGVVMNLVAGATGLLGSEICRLLAAEGKPARALVRTTSDQSKVAQLESLNVEIARGDLKEHSSLDAVCRGASAVISTASSMLSRQEGDSIQTVDFEGQLNLIDAAKAADVSRFVLISFPQVDIEFPLQDAKRAVEDHLKSSGLTYTILQPTIFMEVWLSPALGFDAAKAKAQIYGSGENKISWISYKDVAKFTVASLDNSEARNAVIELGGPEALSPLEVVQIFEKIKGQKFDVQHIPEEALREQRESATDSQQQSFAALMLSYSRGTIIDMQDTLQRFPVQLTSVRDFAQASM